MEVRLERRPVAVRFDEEVCVVLKIGRKVVRKLCSQVVINMDYLVSDVKKVKQARYCRIFRGDGASRLIVQVSLSKWGCAVIGHVMITELHQQFASCRHSVLYILRCKCGQSTNTPIQNHLAKSRHFNSWSVY